MKTIDVLITGCGLTINEHFRIWGDLWSVGDCYVINACGPEEGLNAPFKDDVKQLVVVDAEHLNYFQRRNVFVIAKSQATLNPAAQKYLGLVPELVEDPEDDDEQDEDDGYCFACAGTGEGQYDGAACNSCGGKGHLKGQS